MATAFSLQGSFDYPPDDGEPVAKRPYSQSGSFDSKSEQDLDLTGSGTVAVGFGTVAAAKAMVVEVATTSLGPVNLRVNGGSDDIEVAPGGFWAYSNPAPSAGVTSMSIVHTTDARVQVRLLG
jgi:hypothetical protein